MKLRSKLLFFLLGGGILFFFFPPKSEAEVHIAVLPHFLAPNPKLSDFYRLLATKIGTGANGPRHILLLSPNHFHTCQSAFCSASVPGRVFFGDTSVLMRGFSGITEIGGANGSNSFVSSDDLFFLRAGRRTTQEHGLGAHFFFLEKYFSGATVFPLVVDASRRGDPQKMLVFLEQYIRSLPGKTLILASVDFSHYVSSGYAWLHDEKTRATMSSSTEVSDFRQCEVDCPICLRFGIMLARSTGKFPHLWARDFWQGSGWESTSRQFFLFEQQQKKENGLTFAFLGDGMRDRGVHSTYPTPGKLLNHFAPFFQQGNINNPLHGYKHRPFFGIDVVAMNLETSLALSGECPKQQNQTGKILLCSDAQFIDSIRSIGITAVSLANNHSFDRGLSGRETTKNILAEKNMASISYEKPRTGEVRGLHFAVFGIDTTNSLSGKKQSTCSDILEYKKQGFLNIAFVHWGREYEKTHSPDQEILGKKLIDCGADAVMGSHPHVVQDIGWYKEKPIVYSLGNFLFDQTFMPETMTGGVALLYISSSGEVSLQMEAVKAW